jgi:hypothetical protein
LLIRASTKKACLSVNYGRVVTNRLVGRERNNFASETTLVLFLKRKISIGVPCDVGASAKTDGLVL